MRCRENNFHVSLKIILLEIQSDYNLAFLPVSPHNSLRSWVGGNMAGFIPRSHISFLWKQKASYDLQHTLVAPHNSLRSWVGGNEALTASHLWLCSALHRNMVSKEAIVTALKQEARNPCDLLASFPGTFSLVPECLGMRLVTWEYP